MSHAIPKGEMSDAKRFFSNPEVRELIARDSAMSRPDPKLLSKDEFLARLNATV